MYVLGIDVGTTGTKALLLDKDGMIVEKGYKGYKLYSDMDNVEQFAEDWWDACIFAVKACLSKVDVHKVKAISLSTQGASTVAVDGGGKTIGRALTWLDARSVNEEKKLRRIVGDDYIYKATGWRITPMADSSKILYMKNSKNYNKATKYLSTLEYINHKLTAHSITDPTNSAIRGLYNVEKKCWDEKILNAIGLTKNELPEIKQTGDYVGTLTSIAASALGLNTDVKVYNGAHDQYCSSIGSGAINVGDMLIATGTTWVVMSITSKPLFTPSYIASCTHPIKGRFGNMVSLTGAGSSYQWIKDAMFDTKSFKEIDEECEKRKGKSNRLIFLPWLAGATYPFWQPHAKSAFIGIELSNDKYDMAQSVMESSAFYIKNAIDDFESNGCHTTAIKIMGGASRSEVWMDTLKSVLGIPIYKMEESDTSALGAAMIAAVSLGWYESYEEAIIKTVRYSEIKGKKNIGDYREKLSWFNKISKYMMKFYEGE